MMRTRPALSLCGLALFLLSACTSATGTVPDDFPSIGQLASLVALSGSELDAEISSSIAIYGDEEDLAPLDIKAGVVESMTITYLGDLTVWDYPDGFREVNIDGEYLYRTEDGSWQESDQFEWPLFGPLPGWDVAQLAASSCLGSDPVVIGSDEVAGVATVHISCSGDEGSLDSWIDRTGLVMKLIIEEPEPGTSLRLQTVWEVTALNIEPDGPLPPGA